MRRISAYLASQLAVYPVTGQTTIRFISNTYIHTKVNVIEQRFKLLFTRTVRNDICINKT